MDKFIIFWIDIVFILELVMVAIIWLAIWYLIWKYNSFKEIRKNRDDAVKRSRSSILWEIYEKIMPFLQEFRYSPKDMVFIWKWFDYLILDWLSENDLREIIFMEIKYWTSSLNKNEKMIRQCVGSKRVKYVEFRIPKVD